MAKRYQRGKQNLYIKEGQTTQWSEDTNNDLQNTKYNTKDRTTRSGLSVSQITMAYFAFVLVTIWFLCRIA